MRPLPTLSNISHGMCDRRLTWGASRTWLIENPVLPTGPSDRVVSVFVHSAVRWCCRCKLVSELVSRSKINHFIIKFLLVMLCFEMVPPCQPKPSSTFPFVFPFKVIALPFPDLFYYIRHKNLKYQTHKKDHKKSWRK